jgi:uncharacterized cupredoxin-like copper-binding protein
VNKTVTGPRRIAAIAALAVIVGGVGLLLADLGPGAASAARPERSSVLGPGSVTVKIRIDRSSFSPNRINVRQHTLVRFVLVNHDPIGHEFIIGGPDVHARHENGSEATHPPVPGEVSIPPGETAATTYELHEPGVVEFACHLPGHFQYGMVGSVVVVPQAPVA